MRIIAGTARSLPLKTLDTLETRPTTDRIKETLFNMLQNDISGAYFLDLFAGSGQMGLESLSRGGAYSVFVEKNKKAAACISDNIAFTKFDKQSKLYVMDVLSALRMMEGQYQFDLIFMDPPYHQQLEQEVLTCLSDSKLLKKNTRIIVEAALDTSFDYLEDLGFFLEKRKVYKTNVHAFITKKE